jgi:hypothetical protein
MLIEIMASTANEAAVEGAKFGFIEAMEEGGPVAWSILGIMIIMSVGSFYILITKFLEQNFARGGHRGFQDRMTSEAMPGMIYKPEEAGALLASELAHKMDMYQDATWRSWADRSVEQWLAERMAVA